MNVSFSGCGFIGLYHVGAASCLQTYAPFVLENKLAGASAGAMAAAAIIADVPLAVVTRAVLNVSCRANEKVLGPFNPTLNLNGLLEEGMRQVFPDDVHLRANNRLHVSLSRLSDRSNLIVNQFESKEDVINVILASSFIPMLSGFIPPKHKGEFVIDGGCTDNVPVFDKNTITVSPFSGDQEICPLDDCELGSLLNLSLPTGPTTSISISKENMQRFKMALLPPKPEDLLHFCQQGFADAYRYLKSRNVIQCAVCREEKLAAGYTTLTEWRRVGGSECEGCREMDRDARHSNLPVELCQVFQEVAEDMIRRNSGVLATLSSLTSAPLRLSLDLAGKTAIALTRMLLPYEKYLIYLLRLSPTAGACPFSAGE